jgi:dihydrofolate reductase
MSTDGFIAGPGGDMSWLTPHLGPNPLADLLMRQIGALLMGNRTHRGDDPNKDTDKEGAFGGQWTGPQIVLTHNSPNHPSSDVKYVDNLELAVTKAKAAAGDKYVNVLGADVARQCLAAGVLDEILTFIAPVMLGDGVPLFRHAGGTSITLEPILETHSPGAVGIWYQVKN